jgi:predicted esterase
MWRLRLATRRFPRALLIVLLTARAAGIAALEGHSEVVTFDQYTPLAGNLMMAERLLTPLTAAQLRDRLAAAGKGLRDQPVDLSHEQFRIYVPAVQPPTGFGVFVFVPPWEENSLPQGWETAFDAQGMIFVSATRSGNQESPLGRREPLAILAAYNVMQRFHVEPSRVYVGGFSGGSRIALRLALGYPDLFHGAPLDAGSDPIGGSELPLPPRALFELFRASSRLIYVTGSQDEYHLVQQGGSVGSLGHWCVANVSTQPISGLGHDLMPPSVVSAALASLSVPVAAPTPKAEKCWARLTADVDGELSEAEGKMERGDLGGARSRLERIDKRYSGLAAPRSVEIAQKLKGGVRPGD